LHDFSLSHADFDDTEDGVMLSSDLDESATSFALACEECESRTMNCDDDSWPKAWIPCHWHFRRHRPSMKEGGRDHLPAIPTTIHICVPQEDEFPSDHHPSFSPFWWRNTQTGRFRFEKNTTMKQVVLLGED
jgi:hypothetical protein